MPGIDGLLCTEIGKYYTLGNIRLVEAKYEAPREIIDGACTSTVIENPNTVMDPPYDNMIRRPGSCSITQNYRLEESVCTPAAYTGTYALVHACKPIFLMQMIIA